MEDGKWARASSFVCLATLMAGTLTISTQIVSSLIHGGPPTSLERLLELKEELTPYDQPAEAQEFYRMKRAPAGATAVPTEKYIAAREKMRNMPRYSTALDSYLPPRSEMSSKSGTFDTWTALGPGNIGGRTRALVIDPMSPTTLYAGGVAGGIWKTTNAGATWSALDDMMANLAVSSMAMDPHDNSVIYAGTGEGFFNMDSVRGAGIFKTTNAGLSWTRLASTNTSDFYYVNDIAVSTRNSNRVYAATRNGVWRSNDGGTMWTQVHASSEFGGCGDLAIRTDRIRDTVFVSCGNAAQATVYRSIHTGRRGAWTPVLTEAKMGRTSLAIAPSNQNIIYALSASIESGAYNHGLYAVFRSTDGGSNWTAQVRNTDPTKLNTVLLSNTVYAFLTECGFGASRFLNQGWYDNVIAVDPVDADRVWVGGIDLFRSDDGGASWGQASHWWVGDNKRAHADHHAIRFHPQYNGSSNKVMYVGNDGGIYRTDDANAGTGTGLTAPCSSDNSSVTWTELNNNYGVTQFYNGTPYPDGQSYFGGTQDNGTLRGADATGSEAWTEILGGDGGYVAVDPSNNDILYAENIGLSIQKSTNGGSSWSPATSGITDGFIFIAPFIMDPNNSIRLWTGGSYVWRTDNGATSWTRASTDFPGSQVTALATAPSNPDYVLAGSGEGFIHSTNAGGSATSTTIWSSTQPQTFAFVSSLAFDPTNENIAYATYSTFGKAHVWKSTDAGASWSSIDGSGATGIPDVPAHSIVVDPFDTNRLYLGTDLGVFTSLDGGSNWAVENTGFANVVTETLALQLSGGRLFAFTHGRGAWRVILQSASNGSLGDWVWWDENGNGVQDLGESGVEGVTVNLLSNTGAQIGATATAADGSYHFLELAPGAYQVEVVLPAGFLFTTPDIGGDDNLDSDANSATGRSSTITLGVNQIDTSLDVGLIGNPTLGDRVWSDINVNGLQDPDESGIPGVAVVLYDGGGAPADSTVTDASGDYQFQGLTTGDYFVEFTLPTSGYIFTEPNQGTDDTTDSDANLTTYRTATTSLGSAGADLSWDAGLAPDDFVTIGVNQTSFGPGDKLTLSLLVNNSDGSSSVHPSIQGQSQADFFLGALLPDGDTIVFFTDLNMSLATGSLSDVATLSPIVARVALSTPFVAREPAFFDFTFLGTESKGTYLMFLAAVLPGGFDDGVDDPGDILALSTTVFSFVP